MAKAKKRDKAPITLQKTAQNAKPLLWTIAGFALFGMFNKHVIDRGSEVAGLGSTGTKVKNWVMPLVYGGLALVLPQAVSGKSQIGSALKKMAIGGGLFAVSLAAKNYFSYDLLGAINGNRFSFL